MLCTPFFSRICVGSVYLCIKRKGSYSQPITVATVSPLQLRLQQAALSCVDLYCHALTLKEKTNTNNPFGESMETTMSWAQTQHTQKKEGKPLNYHQI